jgi:hypothetical protein
VQVRRSFLHPLELGPIGQLLVAEKAEQATHAATLVAWNNPMLVIANEWCVGSFLAAADATLVSEEGDPGFFGEDLEDSLVRRRLGSWPALAALLTQLLALGVDMTALHTLVSVLAFPGAFSHNRASDAESTPPAGAHRVGMNFSSP